MPGTGDIARALIQAGAPVNGHPEDKETPLITAASCGDADVIIVGSDLPGRDCGPSGDFPGYRDIHVGVQRKDRGDELLGLTPGDARRPAGPSKPPPRPM